MSDRHAPIHFTSVLPEEILRQRELKWPDFHPEDFCHRCGRRNPVWYADKELWEIAVASRPRGVVDILCPSCFTELYEQATGETPNWHVRKA